MDEYTQWADNERRRIARMLQTARADYIEEHGVDPMELQEGANPIQQTQERYSNALQDTINHEMAGDGARLLGGIQTMVTANPQGINFQALDPSNSFEEAYRHTMRYYTYDRLREQQEQSPWNTPWNLLDYDTIESAVNKLRKNRVFRIKKSATDEQIAKSMSKYSQKYGKSVSEQMLTIAATVKQAEDIQAKKNRIFQQARRRLRVYTPAMDRLLFPQEVIVSEFAQMVARTRKIADVADVTLDGRGRIIVTTKLLYTKHEHWKRQKSIGRYQFRIDFSRHYPTEGVGVLNITRRFEHYDSPTISNIHMCTGNFGNDLKRDYYTQNLPELVADVIDYVRSPQTRAGYLGFEGDKNKGWDAFLKGAKKMPEGYSFEGYDRDHPDLENRGTPLGDSFDQLEDVQNLLDDKEAQLKRELDSTREDLKYWRKEAQKFQFQITTNYHNVLWNMLRHMSIKDSVLNFYFRNFQERVREGSPARNVEIYDIRLRRVAMQCIAVTVRRYHGALRDEFYISLGDFVEPVQRRFASYPIDTEAWRLDRTGPLQLRFGWERNQDIAFEPTTIEVNRIEPEPSHHIVNITDGSTLSGFTSGAMWENNSILATASTTILPTGLVEYQQAALGAMQAAVQAQGPVSVNDPDVGNRTVEVDMPTREEFAEVDQLIETPLLGDPVVVDHYVAGSVGGFATGT